MRDSLLIDRLEKRWAARCFFLLIFAISVCSNLWPMGDSDFTKMTTFLNDFYSGSASAASNAASLNAIISGEVITKGNVIFFFFTFAIIFIYIFIAVLYSRIYVGDKSGQSFGRSTAAFLVRLPILIAFYILVSIPCVFLSAIIPVIIFFVVPALFFSPILITLEKMNPIDAIAYSFRYTKGKKFSIFWDLLTLFCMYQTAEWLFLLFLPSGSSAGILLHGFSTAFFVIAFGRMNGIFYDRVRIHPTPPIPGSLN